MMNYIRDEINQNTDWRNKDGRPAGSGTAQSKVLEWRTANPAGTKYRCIKDTGLDKKTVYKWWDTSAELPQKRPQTVADLEEFDLDLDMLHASVARNVIKKIEEEEN